MPGHGAVVARLDNGAQVSRLRETRGGMDLRTKPTVTHYKSRDRGRVRKSTTGEMNTTTIRQTANQRMALMPTIKLPLKGIAPKPNDYENGVFDSVPHDH